jgi:hypothetical protein
MRLEFDWEFSVYVLRTIFEDENVQEKLSKFPAYSYLVGKNFRVAWQRCVLSPLTSAMTACCKRTMLGCCIKGAHEGVHRQEKHHSMFKQHYKSM